MDDNSKLIENVQIKMITLGKDRQVQLSEIKSFFDKNNKIFYKDIVLLNMDMINEVFQTKSEYKLRIENIFSLSSSLGKVLDLNNSIKTILTTLKIFEEHEICLKQLNNTNTSQNNNNKNYFYKIFEKNDCIPLVKNEILKSRYDQSNIYSPIVPTRVSSDMTNSHVCSFYRSLYKTEQNFVNDLNSYLKFQSDVNATDSKGKEYQVKYQELTNKISKLFSGSSVNYFKIYSRCTPCFEINYSDLVYNTCDVLIMLYNKLFDKVCYVSNLLSYITRLDKYIQKYLIDIFSDDLQKLSEIIIRKEVDDFDKNLMKIYA